MDDKLHIRLFGGFRLTRNGRRVSGFQSGRIQSLLAYLLLHRDTPQSRQYLAFRFWPDSSESQARANLRQLIYHLRQSMSDPDIFLRIDTHTISWREDAPFSLDVSDFEKAVVESKKAAGNKSEPFRTEELEIAAGTYGGDLFPECYDEWIAPDREHFREEYILVLDRLITCFEGKRDYARAIHYAEKLLVCDRLREKTYMDLMRLHAFTGNRASAIRIYRECEEHLNQELDITPGIPVQQLHERLKKEQEAGVVDIPETAVGRKDLEPAAEKPGSPLPMIGRQSEWKQIREKWAYCRRSHSHMVLISGEAGIGKTRFVQEMMSRVSRQNFFTAYSRCYAAEGSLAYAPVIEWLRSKSVRSSLAGLAPVYLTEVSRLLPELAGGHTGVPPPAPISDSWQRHRFFEALVRSFPLSGNPMMMSIDDLQWCDAETLEWIPFFIRSSSDKPLLVTGTVRIEDINAYHPLHLLRKSLNQSGQITEIDLHALSSAETNELAEQVFGQPLEETQRSRLFRESEGNPLFLVESIQAGMSQGMILTEPADQDELSSYTKPDQMQLPERVRNVIRSRLEILSSEARRVASYAATIGRNFDIRLLQMITGHSTEELLPVLDELLERRILREQADGIVDFTHDKLREVSCATMSRTEQSVVHGKIAEALVRIYKDDHESVSSKVAFHYECAGRKEKAIEYYIDAARTAQRIYALDEATRLLQRALQLLKALPESNSRDQREHSVLLVLGPLLAATRGYHGVEVNEVYTRIRELSTHLDQTASAPVLRSMAISFVVQGDLEESFRLGEQILKIAKDENTSVMEVEGHYVAGVSSFWLGKLSLARTHLKSAIDSFDPKNEQIHIDFYAQQPGIVCKIRYAWTLLYLGEPDRAELWYQQAIADARRIGHPLSLSYALMYGAYIKWELGDIGLATKLTDECVSLADQNGLALWYMIAHVFQSWIHFLKDGKQERVHELEGRLRQYQKAGIRLMMPCYTSLSASACRMSGDTDASLVAVNNALESVSERNECWYLPEILRTKGWILYEQTGQARDAELWFESAADAAKSSGALTLQRRAESDLAALM